MPTGRTERSEIGEPAGRDGARRVRVVQGGPVLIDGPVEVELPDGSVVSSDRFVVALCVCRRSRTYPLCDTSHRRKCRPAAQKAEHMAAGDGSEAGDR